MISDRLNSRALAEDTIPLDETRVLEYFKRFFSLKGSDVIEIGGAVPPEWVKANQLASWTSIDPANRGRSDASDSYRFVTKVAEDSGLPDQSADLVFSCNAFQFLDPFATLKEVQRLLRPGGYLFTYFSPIWDAPDGHQLEYTTFGGKPLLFCEDKLIAPFAHLGSRSEFRDSAATSDPELLDVLELHTYDSTTINRLSLGHYQDALRESGLKVVDLTTSSYLDYRIPLAPRSDKQGVSRSLRIVAQRSS